MNDISTTQVILFCHNLVGDIVISIFISNQIV